MRVCGGFVSAAWFLRYRNHCVTWQDEPEGGTGRRGPAARAVCVWRTVTIVHRFGCDKMTKGGQRRPTSGVLEGGRGIIPAVRQALCADKEGGARSLCDARGALPGRDALMRSGGISYYIRQDVREGRWRCPGEGRWGCLSRGGPGPPPAGRGAGRHVARRLVWKKLVHREEKGYRSWVQDHGGRFLRGCWLLEPRPTGALAVRPVARVTVCSARTCS